MFFLHRICPLMTQSGHGDTTRIVLMWLGFLIE